jgi:hypothetical protein
MKKLAPVKLLLFISIVLMSCSSSDPTKIILLFDSLEAIRNHEAQLGSKEISGTADYGEVLFVTDANDGLYKISTYSLSDDSGVRVNYIWTNDISSELFLDIAAKLDLTNYPPILEAEGDIVSKLRSLEARIQSEFKTAQNRDTHDHIDAPEEDGLMYDASWGGRDELGYSSYLITLTLLKHEKFKVMGFNYKLFPKLP